MTPQDFVKDWSGSELGERQTYQLHFGAVCRLVGVDPPNATGTDGSGKIFQFERFVREQAGQSGFADVYYEDHFAIEYKAPNKGKDLHLALQQLLRYQRQLKNPPLLIVTDIENWRIHTNFNNTVPKEYSFTHSEIAFRPEVRQWISYIFRNPDFFNPEINTHAVTRDSAEALKAVVDNMRQTYNLSPERVARFLTRIIFSLFAEDIDLLTHTPSGKGLFSYLVEHANDNVEFREDISKLFMAMKDGGRTNSSPVRWFNGALFKDVEVETLSNLAISKLRDAGNQNWRYVEPSIFGTVFERCLDPAKRAQLGAHYTSPEDILLIVEPVLMQPLRRKWASIQAKAATVREGYLQAPTERERELHRATLNDLRDQILSVVRNTTVLDPACGSGNFLYIALQEMMALELDIVNSPLWKDLDRAELQVSPEQLYGIEKDEIAHALASIVVWIGYIKWREDHGFRYDEKPLLRDLSDNIVCKDAILSIDDDGNISAPEWPQVDVIIGNPPFLGGQIMRGELGDEYYDHLTRHYVGRVAGGADLVCYWYEVARRQIEIGSAKRAGLLATNSIRGGSNREVLKRIKDSGDIFMAWSDRPWVLDGAAVRVSMVGFDSGSQKERELDGASADNINVDLTASVDIVRASRLTDNLRIAFQGPVKVGRFDIANDEAQVMLGKLNRTGVQNAVVIKPYRNGSDLVQTLRNYWIIDFGDMTIEQAQEFEAPFQYVEKIVKPVRVTNNSKKRREQWWKLGASGRDYRYASKKLHRKIFTSRVAKHRIFVWVGKSVFPGDAVVAIARDDDYFFGVLHSKLHEVWSLRMGTSLEDRPRYTPTTTFETFPFPWPPGQEDTAHPAHARVSAAAKLLHEERHAWLNPDGASAKGVKDRTLTNLYNALQVYRGEGSVRVKPAAADFAPRLDTLHRELDEAVCDAYGWDYAILDDEETVLRKLLALNLERAAQSG